MSYWTYKVMEMDRDKFTIVEAFYDDDGFICQWSEPITDICDSVEELRETLTRMVEACDKHIIIEIEMEDE
jgi:hypothetical protein